MKTFVKDYAQLCKDAGKFYKNHWKGMVVLNAAIIGAEVVYLEKGKIKGKLKEKFHKKES